MTKSILIKLLQDYFVESRNCTLVYLFGSRSRGNDQEDSDLDLGILFKSTLTDDQRHRLKLKIMTDLNSDTGINQIDIVDFNTADPEIAFSVLATCEILYAKN